MLNKQEFRQNYHKKTNIIKNYNNKNRQNTHKKKKIRENPYNPFRVHKSRNLRHPPRPTGLKSAK